MRADQTVALSIAIKKPTPSDPYEMQIPMDRSAGQGVTITMSISIPTMYHTSEPRRNEKNDHPALQHMPWLFLQLSSYRYAKQVHGIKFPPR